jgi:hypothetical protein
MIRHHLAVFTRHGPAESQILALKSNFADLWEVQIMDVWKILVPLLDITTPSVQIHGFIVICYL